MSTFASSIIAPWSSAPVRPLDMPLEEPIYPEAFFHFTLREVWALSCIELSYVETSSGCPVQCAGCGANAKLPVDGRFMDFERFLSLAYGIASIHQNSKMRVTGNLLRLFDATEPLYYHSRDRHGNLVNFYHTAQTLFQIAKIPTYITTSGWPVGDNFMHCAMQMAAPMAGKENSPIQTIAYSMKTSQKMARFELSKFIDGCLDFLFTAPESDVVAKYSRYAKHAMRAREMFGKSYSENPESIRNDPSQLKAGLLHDTFDFNTLSYSWIFEPFMNELFKLHFFKRMRANIDFLNEQTPPRTLFNRPFLTLPNFIDTDSGYTLSGELRKFEYFFSKEFMHKLALELHPREISDARYIGIGKAQADFGIMAPQVREIESSLISGGNLLFTSRFPPFKSPHMIFSGIEFDGTLRIFAALDSEKVYHRYLSSDELLALTGRVNEKEAEIFRILAGINGRNIFEDLDRQG